MTTASSLDCHSYFMTTRIRHDMVCSRNVLLLGLKKDQSFAQYLL